MSIAQRGRRDQRGVGDPDAVVGFVLLLDAAQDLDGVLDARLADEDLLEAPLQGGVLLDPLAVLVQRRRTDHVQLAAGEHRLEHVAGVHRRVAPRTRADDGVELVDEGDDLPAGVLDLLEHRLEPLLELPAILRAGHHRGQVEAQHATALERVGNVSRDDALGQALDDRGLADAGLADEHRVVLGAPRQHLDDAPDLGIAPDDGVEPAVLGRLGEVDGELLQRLVRRLGVLAGDPTVAADGRDGLAQPVGGESGVDQHLAGRRLDGGDRDEEVVGGDEVVLHGAGQVERRGEDPRQRRGGAGLLDGRAGGARQGLEGRLGRGRQGRRVDPRLHDEVATRAVLLAQQGDEQVDGLGVGVAAGRGRQLGGLDDLAAAGGELLCTELAQLRSSRVAMLNGATVVPPGATRQKLSRFPSTLGRKTLPSICFILRTTGHS